MAGAVSGVHRAEASYSPQLYLPLFGYIAYMFKISISINITALTAVTVKDLFFVHQVRVTLVHLRLHYKRTLYTLNNIPMLPLLSKFSV